MRFAAIDLGGSFIKSALVDPRTGALERVQRTPFPPFTTGLHPSYREVALEPIARAFAAHIDPLLAESPAGILISTQMHGFVLGDRFYSWQDQRSLVDGSYDAFEGSLSDNDRARVGNELGPGHAAAVLHAMLRSGDAPDGGTPLPLPNAFVDSHTADATLAASFGVYDVQRGAWAENLIAKLGLDRFEWPRITRCNDVVGEYRGFPVHSPIGDQQAALAGSDLDGDELSINVGTGCQVSALAATFRRGAFKVRPYVDDRFLETVTHIPSGRALNVLAGLVGGDWSAIDAAVEAIAETDLIVDLSFYPGAFGSRGRIDNIHERNLSPGHLFLAAFENMAANHAAAALRLRPDGDWGPLVLSGGLVHRFPRLRALIVSRLGRAYRLSGSEDETLTGLGRLAQNLRR